MDVVWVDGIKIARWNYHIHEIQFDVFSICEIDDIEFRGIMHHLKAMRQLPTQNSNPGISSDVQSATEDWSPDVEDSDWDFAASAATAAAAEIAQTAIAASSASAVSAEIAQTNPEYEASPTTMSRIEDRALFYPISEGHTYRHDWRNMVHPPALRRLQEYLSRQESTSSYSPSASSSDEPKAKIAKTAVAASSSPSSSSSSSNPPSSPSSDETAIAALLSPTCPW